MLMEVMGGQPTTYPTSTPTEPVAGYLPTSSSNYTSHHPEPQETIGEEIFDEPARPLSKDEVMREAIVKALRRSGGRRKEAARELFMSERTLYRKIKDLGIDEI
jgi:DNA-binding NtrC family response regulator